MDKVNCRISGRIYITVPKYLSFFDLTTVFDCNNFECKYAKNEYLKNLLDTTLYFKHTRTQKYFVFERWEHDSRIRQDHKYLIAKDITNISVLNK